jgi:hypothetical protein
VITSGTLSFAPAQGRNFRIADDALAMTPNAISSSFEEISLYG